MDDPHGRADRPGGPEAGPGPGASGPEGHAPPSETPADAVAGAPHVPRTAPPRHGASWVIAVVGGIASGKSSVGRRIAGEDGVVLSADDIAHAALASQEVTQRVRERFGEGALGADGKPDRAALAAIVFRDAGARKALEGWIHGIVRERLRADLERALEGGVPRIVLDVPLLMENAGEHGLLELCDRVVFVDAPLEARDRRATRNRGWEPGEVARREAAQLPLAAKRARADVVIDNDDTEEALDLRVRAFLAALEA